MPSMTADDDHPFDPRATSCIGMGIVAQTFWQLPGVLRSDSPHARRGGPQAARASPPRTRWMSRMDSTARLAGHMNWMAGAAARRGSHRQYYHPPGRDMRRARYRRKKYVTLLKEGRLSRFDYTEIDHCCHELQPCRWLAGAKGCSAAGRWAAREARLVRSSDVIRVVTEKIQQNETVFLHPFGVDEE